MLPQLPSQKLPRRGLAVAAFAGLCLLFAGCGPLVQNRTSYAPRDAFAIGPADSAYDDPLAPHPHVEGEYVCPAKPNVVPDYDYNFNGTGSFSVCKSTASAYRVAIHGSTSQSDQICGFPVQFVDENHVFVKPDATGKPMYKCVQITDDPAGVTLTFDLTNYNAIFIVERPYRDQMRTCLAAGNYSFCPPFAYGLFR